MKLLVSSQHTLHPSYEEISRLQDNYCLGKFQSKGVETIKFSGSKAYRKPSDLDKNIEYGNSYYSFNKDTNFLYLDCPDLIDSENSFDPRGNKVLNAFRFLLDNYDFDILLTTTSSTYLDVDRILKLTETLPKQRLYAGAISGVDDVWFVISAFAFISKDLIETLVKNEDKYIKYTSAPIDIKKPYAQYEDICIGRIFKEANLNLKIEDQPFIHHPVLYKPEIDLEKVRIYEHVYAYRFSPYQTEAFKKLHTLI